MPPIFSLFKKLGLFLFCYCCSAITVGLLLWLVWFLVLLIWMIILNDVHLPKELSTHFSTVANIVMLVLPFTIGSFLTFFTSLYYGISQRLTTALAFKLFLGTFVLSAIYWFWVFDTTKFFDTIKFEELMTLTRNVIGNLVLTPIGSLFACKVNSIWHNQKSARQPDDNI
jgi:hypothetical protein